jgi:hypothetical protein
VAHSSLVFSAFFAAFSLFLTSNAVAHDRYTLDDECALSFLRDSDRSAPTEQDVRLSWIDFETSARAGQPREEDHSYRDYIRILKLGIPKDLTQVTLRESESFLFFPYHPAMTNYFQTGVELRNSLLNFQVLLASPGRYWETDERRKFRQIIYQSLSGVLLVRPGGAIHAEWGRPLRVRPKFDVRAVELQSNLLLIPGEASKLCVPMEIEELSDDEWKSMTPRSRINLMDYRR